MRNWLKNAVQINLSKNKDMKEILSNEDNSSHAFCINLLNILLNFCEPFSDPTRTDLVFCDFSIV